MADVLPASSPDTDRNLLFGVLALQGAFLDSNQFAEACAAWTLLTGSADRTARLWDAATGQPRGKVLLHPGYVRRVAFAPDGRKLATVSGHAVRLWDAETGQPLGPALRHDELVSSVAFGPDGQTAVTGTVGSSRLWTLPPPLEGDASRVRLWAEALTGMVPKNDGTATELDVSSWRQRSEKD
jgi:WD40 repeat protein